MAQYTCITCRVAFKEADLQRLHYKTDWHRYNLKRKVAEFPPVTSEDFLNQVVKQQQLNENQLQQKGVYCKVCHASFANQNSYANHLNSKKHKVNENRVEDDVNSPEDEVQAKVDVDDASSDTDEVDSDEWDEDCPNPIDFNNCLFCSFHSGSFSKNLKHMSSAHSFFVPDLEYCTDLKGLLYYLGEKIEKDWMCLWCNDKGKRFHSAESAKQHMLDKGHCKMIHEGIALVEYAPFYDYSSSYPDATGEEINVDDEIDVPEIDGSDFQLVLPSGSIIGHRSLMRYYKQSLSGNTQVVVSNNQRKLHQVLSHYKALGWTNTQQTITRKARDIAYMRKIQSKLQLKVSEKTNKIQMRKQKIYC